jgi:hypothetical protein
MHPLTEELIIKLGLPRVWGVLFSSNDRLANRHDHWTVASSIFLNNNTKFEEIGAANEGQ